MILLIGNGLVYCWGGSVLGRVWWFGFACILSLDATCASLVFMIVLLFGEFACLRGVVYCLRIADTRFCCDYC